MSRPITKKRANLRDVASHAGVSVATVSRVLNAPDKVAPETRNRVESTIANLKFVPSAAARAINRGRSGMVAALLPTLDNAIYARVVNGLEAGLAARQLSLMVGQTGDDPATELARAKQLLDIGAEAFVVVGVTHDPGLYELMERAQTPIVATSYYEANGRLPTIGYDNWEAAQLAARHLSDLGHKRIAVLHGDLAANDRMRRRKAALEDMSMDITFEYFEVPFATEGGHIGIADLLASNFDATAVLCFSDVIAQGALSNLQSSGLRIPQDISIIGMEDLPGSRFTYPALSSIRLSVEEMGRRAADAVSDWLDADIVPSSAKLSVELVHRDTTARHATDA